MIRPSTERFLVAKEILDHIEIIQSRAVALANASNDEAYGTHVVAQLRLVEEAHSKVATHVTEI